MEARTSIKAELPLPFVGIGWPLAKPWEDLTRSRRPCEGSTANGDATFGGLRLFPTP